MTINIQLFCCDEPSKLRQHDFFMSTSVTGDSGDPGTRVGPCGRDRLLTALMPACDQTAVVEHSEAWHLCQRATKQLLSSVAIRLSFSPQMCRDSLQEILQSHRKYRQNPAPEGTFDKISTPFLTLISFSTV